MKRIFLSCLTFALLFALVACSSTPSSNGGGTGSSPDADRPSGGIISSLLGGDKNIAASFLTIRVGKSVIDMSRPFEELVPQLIAEGFCVIDPMVYRIYDANGEYSTTSMLDKQQRDSLTSKKNAFYISNMKIQTAPNYQSSVFCFGSGPSYVNTPFFETSEGITKDTTLEMLEIMVSTGEIDNCCSVSSESRSDYLVFFVDGEPIDLEQYRNDLYTYVDLNAVKSGDFQSALRSDYPYADYVLINGLTSSLSIWPDMPYSDESIEKLALLYLAGCKCGYDLTNGTISNCGTLVCGRLGNGVELRYSVVTFKQ